MKLLILLLFLCLSCRWSGQQIPVTEYPPVMPLHDLLYVISPFFQRVDCKQSSCFPLLMM